MQQRITLKLLPSEAAVASIVQQYAAQTIGVPTSAITGYHVIKQSIDARGRQTWIMMTILAFVNEPYHERTIKKLLLQNVSKATRQVIIVGAGPAGLFAALKLIEQGIKPILLERGKDVRSRRRDLAVLNKQGIVNSESNYCFGEGGAGTYSDGKLYTRSTKRGDVERILNILVQFGAHEKILYEAHPHIGTNKLPEIITAIREQIISCGGEFLFEQKVTDLLIQNDTIHGVKTASGNIFNADAVILATGHSARDIFELLYNKNILIEAKPFALGVRVEHPQSIIDSIQYHCSTRNELLPPASYSLVQQVHERGVFSFCMCPGGIIAPASTSEGELVVNGWSPSKRNNPFANSGIVSAVELKDIMNFQKAPSSLSRIKEMGPLCGMYFQQAVERKAFQYGGGKFVAPAQRMADFTQKKQSSSLPDCSYLPGIASAPLNEVLPPFIYSSLQQAFIEFGKKMKGYFTNEAVLVATESRTSSPVRIPRDATTQHPQIKKLFPCGEGAGYAGGIVSAAMDGERVAINAERIMLNA
ncbi:FAD-binding protein [Niastella caeni]|uniref:FAD-binding protein n=1 Tax=Niastella caeni TaxID=2569763 RepID=A0A4S8I3U6_9BACT|nr:FAD-dependent oxidoreductase [Niastella caeni]THU41002.1 FAD-binding protein [Niastella caeni]